MIRWLPMRQRHHPQNPPTERLSPVWVGRLITLSGVSHQIFSDLVREGKVLSDALFETDLNCQALSLFA